MKKSIDFINLKKDLILKLFFGLNIIFAALIIFRSAFGIVITDEPFNIGEAFRTVQGNKFLVENWDFFQTGDSFMYPFLKLFYMITGSTKGIVLYSRIIFIIIQILFSVFSYKILSNFFDKRAVMFTVFLYTSAISLKLFNMWYDNWELLFRFIGLLLLFYVFENEETISKKKVYLICFIAGISHACMVFAYPTMIVVFIFTICLCFFYNRKKSKKTHTIMALMYGLGALCVFAVFMVYALSVGIHNIFALNSSISTTSLDSSGRPSLVGLKYVRSKIYMFIICCYNRYKFSVCFFTLEIIVFKYLEKNKKSFLLLYVMFVLGCAVHMVESGLMWDSLNSLLTYLSFHAPLFYKIKKRYNEAEALKYKKMFWTIFVPSYLAGLAYAYTGLGYAGALKFASGARCASIITILLLFDIIRENKNNRLDSNVAFATVCTAIVCLNIVNLYYSGFQSTKPFRCNTVATSGVFAGLIDTKENVDKYEELETALNETIQEGDKTITCGSKAMMFYLMTDLKPNTNTFGSLNGIESLKMYFDAYYGMSDIIILHKDSSEYKKDDFINYISQNYTLITEISDYLIYHR